MVFLFIVTIWLLLFGTEAYHQCSSHIKLNRLYLWSKAYVGLCLCRHRDVDCPLEDMPKGIPHSLPCFSLPFQTALGNEEALMGTWLGFTGQAEFIQPVVTNSLYCHPSSIVLIVTRNQTHTRGRRLIGCTLECFHPPLHMTEYWNSQHWYLLHKALYPHTSRVPLISVL